MICLLKRSLRFIGLWTNCFSQRDIKVTKNIRIAIIGAGYISDYHARALQKLASVEIKAVAAQTVKSAKQFSEKYNIETATNDALSLAGRNDIDAVLINTPNYLHAPYAIDFLKNNKDVFLEKPMAMNTAEGNRIAKSAAEAGRLVMVGHMWRFDEEVNYVKSVISSGKVGKIFKTKGYGIHENWGPDGWFTQKEKAGGGALIDMGVHAIDTVSYLLGEPQPVEVYAKTGTYFGDYNVDDSGLIMITWANGTTSVIESGWYHPHRDGPEAGTQLFGTLGYASLFPTKLKLQAGDPPAEFIASFTEKKEHCDQSIYNKQMIHFIDCVRKRKNPSPGIEEGMAVLKIVDAAYRSAKTGQAVVI